MTELYRNQLFIDAPVEHVFRFFVEPDLLVRWLGRRARLHPAPGGEFRFEVATGEWCVGTYLEVDPPHRVVFTWGWENPTMGLAPGSSTVEVDLAVEGRGTRLTLVHHGLVDPEVFEIHADGWPRYLARLDRATRGEDPGPDPAAESPEQARRRLRR